MSGGLLLAMVFAAGANAPAAAAPKAAWEQPVAVLPFKNLNDDVALEWLKVGIAETMVSDLKKSGNVRVVERDQIDRALTEIALQEAKSSDESAAARVGKLVGARTIVLGSFQKADKQVRINARFVAVETGVVLDTAKSTGPLEKIFALQDEVVDRLLTGAAVKKTAPRPVRKTGAKTVEAYKCYAMALVVASDADRVGYLKRSLALDPDFVYATDELAALELRMAGYAAVRSTASDARDLEAWAKIKDPKAPIIERTIASNMLLGTRMSDRKYRRLLADAQTVLTIDIPDASSGVAGAHDVALFDVVLAYQQLRKPDLALQAGEQYLKRFPAGVWYKQVEQIMKAIIDDRRMVQEGQAMIDARFAEQEVERAKLLAMKNPYPPAALAGRLRNLDLERCWFPRRNDIRDYRRALEGCDAFLKQYAGDPEAKEDLLQARSTRIEALGELGMFDQAIPEANALLAEVGPKHGVVSQTKSLLEWVWPKDAL